MSINPTIQSRTRENPYFNKYKFLRFEFIITVVMKGLSSHVHTAFLLGLFFNPEDEGNMILRNVNSISTDYTALYPRQQNSSKVNFLPNVSTLG
jgi:hypothetical protein